jgi:type II secretion system (T2SS) protein G
MTEPVPPPAAAVPPRRPDVPLPATCLTLFVGAGLFVCVCAGGVVLGVARDAEPRLARSRASRREAAEAAARTQDAKSLLAAMADRLGADARASGELPETLGEAPPRDPWGNAVIYDRSAPDRATLRSAGPDGKPGTRDDVRREVRAGR